jgi:chloride channel protein, CIC family
MKSIRSYFSSSRFVGPIIVAAFVGAGTALAAIVFIRWIEICQDFFFGTLLTTVASLGLFFAHYGVILIPAIGALVVGLVVVYLAPEAKGHGVPEVLKAIALKRGRIRPMVVLGKALASGLAIGSGASVGREGPIVQVGSALGSSVGRLFRATESRTKIFIACGAAAGISAVFNAPIAGVMFALEVILKDFTTRALSAVVVASVMASIISRIFLGESPAFHIPLYRLENPLEIILYVVLGILAAWVALLFVEVLYQTEGAFDRWRAHKLAKPVVGGLMLGVIGFFAPQLFGTGFGAIEEALRGETFFGVLAALVVLKILATSITLGSGSSGGVFAPALFIGAVLGGAFGKAVEHLVPFTTAPAGAYALVGMSSVFAAAAHAPITAILIVFEMTGDYRMILPLMLGTVVATAIAQMIRQESIYTLKLKRGGVDVTSLSDARLMDSILVEQAKSSDFVAVSRKLEMYDLVEAVRKHKGKTIFTVDEKDELTGQVSLPNLEELLFERDSHLIIADDVCVPAETCFPTDNLNDALRLMLQSHSIQIAVVDPEYPKKIIGVLRREDILGAYTQVASKRATLLGEIDATHDETELSAEEIKFHVSRHSLLIGKQIQDLALPEGTVFASIRRGKETVIPRGGTVIKGGDRIITLVSKKSLDEFAQWKRQNKV